MKAQNADTQRVNFGESTGETSSFIHVNYSLRLLKCTQLQNHPCTDNNRPKGRINQTASPILHVDNVRKSTSNTDQTQYLVSCKVEQYQFLSSHLNFISSYISSSSFFVLRLDHPLSTYYHQNRNMVQQSS